jgi:hypothetical protein
MYRGLNIVWLAFGPRAALAGRFVRRKSIFVWLLDYEQQPSFRLNEFRQVVRRKKGGHHLPDRNFAGTSSTIKKPDGFKILRAKSIVAMLAFGQWSPSSITRSNIVATASSARFGAAASNQMCERFCTPSKSEKLWTLPRYEAEKMLVREPGITNAEELVLSPDLPSK